MHDEDSKTKPTPNYPENSEWAGDDRETEQQLATLDRIIKQQREAKEREAKEPRPTEKEFTALTIARMKADRDRKVQEAPSADALEWKSHRYGLPPGVMALLLSRTLHQI